MRKKEGMGRILGVTLVLALIRGMVGKLANKVIGGRRYLILVSGGSTLICLERRLVYVVAIDGACSWKL